MMGESAWRDGPQDWNSALLTLTGGRFFRSAARAQTLVCDNRKRTQMMMMMMMVMMNTVTVYSTLHCVDVQRSLWSSEMTQVLRRLAFRFYRVSVN